MVRHRKSRKTSRKKIEVVKLRKRKGAKENENIKFKKGGLHKSLKFSGTFTKAEMTRLDKKKIDQKFTFKGNKFVMTDKLKDQVTLAKTMMSWNKGSRKMSKKKSRKNRSKKKSRKKRSKKRSKKKSRKMTKSQKVYLKKLEKAIKEVEKMGKKKSRKPKRKSRRRTSKKKSRKAKKKSPKPKRKSRRRTSKKKSRKKKSRKTKKKKSRKRTSKKKSRKPKRKSRRKTKKKKSRKRASKKKSRKYGWNTTGCDQKKRGLSSDHFQNWDEWEKYVQETINACGKDMTCSEIKRLGVDSGECVGYSMKTKKKES